MERDSPQPLLVARAQSAAKPRPWLERAGLLFQDYECFVASVGAFSRLAAVDPESAPAWYGLANTLFCLAGPKRDVTLLRDAVACVKSALKADPNHQLATDLLEKLPRETPLSQGEVDGVEAFTVVPADLAEQVGLTERSFAEAMLAVPPHGRRMQVVMWLGILDEPCGTEILLAALDDVNADVRMAALKRLHPAGDSRIVAKLQQLATSGAGRSSEPYLSMALRRFVGEEVDPDHWAVRLLASLEKKGPTTTLPAWLDPQALGLSRSN